MTARMNSMIYNGCKSLRTTDNCIKGILLNQHSHDNLKPLEHDCIKVQERSVLATITNVLSPHQCKEIVNNSKQNHSFENMLDKYKVSQRNNSRMLILDKGFASNLWRHLETEVTKIFSDNHLPFQPLGFDVQRGEWQLYGLNEAFRVNRYSANKKEFFSVHKDAQYCPNGDRRSLLTLLVYLNDKFEGGETVFYFPKQSENIHTCKDMTAEEEIKNLGGLGQGYDSFQIEPSAGKAVIFSHDILHESIPVATKTKYVLKTDVVVRRSDKSYGFAVTDEERSDYLQCLNHFRQAQAYEMDGNKVKAGELFEKALSIRYCYPMALDSKQCIDSSQKNNEYVDCDYILPNSIWQDIFCYLSGKDVENVLKAFPGLYLTSKAREKQRCIKDSAESSKQALHIPFVDNQFGISTQFRFKDSFFFSENEEACIRVAAMYAFYLLGHKADDQFYTVRYNPETQEVCTVALKSLLTDVFLNRPCFGSVYAVSQQDPLKRDVPNDFAASVDHSYMTMRHGAQFLGAPIAKQMKVNVKWLGVSDQAILKHIKDNLMEDDSDDSSEMSLSSDDEAQDKPIAAKVDEKIDSSSCVNDNLHDNEDSQNTDQSETTDDEQVEETDQSNASNNEETEEINQLDTSDSEESYLSDDLKEKILEVSKDNILDGEYSQNEFIRFYDTSDQTSSSVPVTIRDVVVYESLKSFFSEYSYQPDWFEEYLHNNLPTHYTSLTEEIEHDFTGAESLYLETLKAICECKPGVSAAIVTHIKKHTKIDEHMCFCYWPGGEGYDQIYKANKPKCYNHLVFDFSTHQMIVTKSKDNSSSGDENKDAKSRHRSFFCDDYCTFTSEFYEKFCEKKLNGELTDVFIYKVDISRILEQANGFNHASCNCSVPAFEFEECHNLQDYPVLEHIHIAGGVNLATNEVILWTFYGGIAAL